jgi:Ca2+-transporting ATPase
MVEVIRSGKLQRISVYDILAGDVIHLQPGDLVPADGVFISGYNVKCDESSITGESDQKRKTPGGEVMNQIEAGASVDKIDPFIISGSKVLEGTGTYLVTSVGLHSSYGKLIMATADDSEATPTPLQMKLNIMAEQITKCGCAIALLLFLVLFAKFLAQLKTNPDTPAQKAQDFLQIVIVTITIIVIAVPEGLPLAVTLALAFAMTKMVKDHNLVRVLSSCETMGNATAICSDKTGTLTTNKMTVVAGSLGTACQFGVRRETVIQGQGIGEQAAAGEFVAASFSELASLLSPEVKDLLVQSIAINSTAFESDEDGKRTFIGSKTETALLSFAKEHLGIRPISEERANATIVQIFPFDSGRKCMASVVRLFDGTYRVYVKGAPEVLLDKCTQIIADTTGPVKSIKLTKGNRHSLASLIDKYASNSLRTLGIIYRDLEYWPPYGARTYEDDSREAVFEDIFEEMVFLGIVGIQDPLRPGVKEAVERCQHAGVFVRMVTGDNRGTAKAIAEECGIYTDGIVLEGPEFRKLSRMEMNRTLPKLQVLARSSPEDKRILVKKLKELGNIVAVTGDGTNDGPALRAADVGFSMGVSGTEVAKEASSIILMDDNFSSIVKALEWGRAVNDSVKKFLQVSFSLSEILSF